MFTATRSTHFVIAGIAAIAYALAFAPTSLAGAAFFFPFIMTPIVVNAGMARKAKALISQVILLMTTIAYSGWAVYLYVDAMIIHVDPQSAILLLFTGIVALPVLIAVWLLCLSLEREARRP